jgi:hypothetical protein
MPDDPALPSDDPRAPLRKMIAMLDKRILRLEKPNDDPEQALAEAQSLRTMLVALLEQIESRRG